MRALNLSNIIAGFLLAAFVCSHASLLCAQDSAVVERPDSGAASKLVQFETKDGKYQFQIDATQAPDLHHWSKNELAPVVRQWYPKIAAMLSSEGFQPATKVKLLFKNKMPAGVPAYAQGAQISMSASWFRDQLDNEAKGCVVHELVHVVQAYWQNRRANPNALPPSWFVEGMADYIRWFLYEPDTRGAYLSPQSLKRVKHDDSYRVTGNFIDWVVRTHDPDQKKNIVRRLNAAAREGKYSDALWKKLTGKDLQTLSDAWRQGD